MNHTELEDFKTEIVRCGYKFNDFEVNEEFELIGNPGIKHGIVKVKHLPTNKTKSYKASHLQVSWIINFSNDLKSGFFK